ncbi:hypothetical protein, partial [Pseudomonas syringae]|uniref:hypothetical protein n=1 Tax=Pseudomonas syringae TaxID=317 RepID=UPI001FEDCDF6
MKRAFSAKILHNFLRNAFWCRFFGGMWPYCKGSLTHSPKVTDFEVATTVLGYSWYLLFSSRT